MPLANFANQAAATCRHLLPATAHPAVVLCWALALLLTGCSADQASGPKTEAQKKPAPPVSIGVSSTKSVPVVLQATGHVEPSATVGIRSQVTGTLKTVHFREGEAVKAGELLFSIDPGPFANRLSQAEAALAKTTAELANARTLLARYAQAAQKGYVSAEQADQAATRVSTLSASLKAEGAAIDTARLELAYCSIRSPLSGFAGELLADPGNLIKANADAPMVTLNQVEPILVSFAVPGTALAAIRQHWQAGPLGVEATQAGTGEEPSAGELAFVDNAIDQSTGTIRLKASFANRGRALWPGQTVDVRLLLATRPDAVVVPSQALQTGQKGTFVFVVRTDQTVERREVTAGAVLGRETVVEKGLAADERVVTDGMMQLTDGVKVEERGPQAGGKKERQEGGQPPRTAP